MRVTDKDFEFMLECQERDIATMLVEEQGMTIHQALDVLYGSESYRMLRNPSTGLYFQSPRYVLSYLKDELNGNICASNKDSGGNEKPCR